MPGGTAAACPAVCPAGGFCCAAGLFCAKLKLHIPSTAIHIARRFMRSPCSELFPPKAGHQFFSNRAFYRSLLVTPNRCFLGVVGCFAHYRFFCPARFCASRAPKSRAGRDPSRRARFLPQARRPTAAWPSARRAGRVRVELPPLPREDPYSRPYGIRSWPPRGPLSCPESFPGRRATSPPLWGPW